MTVNDIFFLRSHEQLEEAYEAARQLYANDKGPHASLAMFWTAIDVLRKRMADGAVEEAHKILLALQRMLPRVPDPEGHAHAAFERCSQLLKKVSERTDEPEHLQMGQWGEQVAADYLRRKGYTIIDSDWHSGHRDIDLVAMHEGILVFVEVKTRRNCDFSDPLQAIDYKKRSNLRLAINHYLKYHHVDSPVRFDVISVVGALGCLHPEVVHLEDISLL